MSSYIRKKIVTLGGNKNKNSLFARFSLRSQTFQVKLFNHSKSKIWIFVMRKINISKIPNVQICVIHFWIWSSIFNFSLQKMWKETHFHIHWSTQIPLKSFKRKWLCPNIMNKCHLYWCFFFNTIEQKY